MASQILYKDFLIKVFKTNGGFSPNYFTGYVYDLKDKGTVSQAIYASLSMPSLKKARKDCRDYIDKV